MKLRLAIGIMGILAFSSWIWSKEPNLSESDKKLWILCIKRVKMKPPCCGACKIITQTDAKGLWEYMTSDSPEKKTGKNQALWLEHKTKLLEEFKHLNPQRYQELYGNQDLPIKQDNKGGNRL